MASSPLAPTAWATLTRHALPTQEILRPSNCAMSVHVSHKYGERHGSVTGTNKSFPWKTTMSAFQASVAQRSTVKREIHVSLRTLS